MSQMKEITLTSWEAFEDELDLNGEMSARYPSLFRGQSRAEPGNVISERNWDLKTTLERHGKVNYPVKEYYRAILRAEQAVETVTGRKWDLSRDLSKEDDLFRAPEGLAFMAFLRQNGFPSPLLDWSRSPFIAAFFAFRDDDSNRSDYVAVFKYVEYTNAGKSLRPKEAAITRCGPWIGTDKKHFLQQSEYTVCRKKALDGLDYISHEEAFARGEKDQDILVKYLIPVSERDRVLRKLRHMNINPYSLFESTESLLESLKSDVIQP
jgi:hypothetical protein